MTTPAPWAARIKIIRTPKALANLHHPNGRYQKNGSIVYWYQPKMGLLFLRGANGYEQTRIEGAPDQFKARANELGASVELWQSDGGFGEVSSIVYLVDNQGLVRLAILRSGNTVQRAWVQSSNEPFAAEATIYMDERYDAPVQLLPAVSVKLDADRTNVVMETTLGSIAITPQALDELIEELSEFRRRLAEAVPADPAPNSQISAELDPRWQVIPSPHKKVPGRLLLLRHAGLGWRAFLIPPSEASDLADWLKKSENEA